MELKNTNSMTIIGLKGYNNIAGQGGGCISSKNILKGITFSHIDLKNNVAT